MKHRASEVLALLARLCVATVFAWAALPKLAQPAAFASDVQNYRLLPEALVGHVALFLPAFELVVALGLLVPRYQRGAALMATGMLLSFSVAMASARMRGIDLSCGCFGAAFEAKVSWLTVTRSAALSVLAALPVFLPRHMPRSEPSGQRSAPSA
jgi:putative oxidoreductase